MCPGCGRIWTVLQVLWSLVYVTCGAAQLVAGIFFIISLPELHLSCNILVGSWNVVVGIVAGMVACFGQISAKRQELLLYMAVSILAANTVNAVLSEWCFYWADFPQLLLNRPYQTLIHYACSATRAATIVILLISLLDTQLAFCSMQATKKESTRKLRRSHEQVSDIEYIIPRPKPSNKPYNAFTPPCQSWVFESDNGSYSIHTNSPYLKLPQNGTPKTMLDPQNKLPDILPTAEDTAHLIATPVLVKVEEPSYDSASNSDRNINCMKSFSQSASPVILSASSSQLSLNNSIHNPPIYECLERLTEPSVYRSRLDSALSNKEESYSNYHSPQPGNVRRIGAVTPQGEKVQYASVMKELQNAIVTKKETDVLSPQSDSTTASEKTQSKGSSSRHESSHGKNSDAEFSKELEAALQLIQDLESPNTIETPSEPKLSFEGRETHALAVWRNSDASDSEKTLSAVDSLAELTSPVTECHPELCSFKPLMHGKGARLVVHCDSQSTSGYSSPTHKSSSNTPNNWSTASSVNSSHNDLGKTLACSIHNTKSTAVISLYSQDNTLKPNNKSVTLVNIPGNNDSEIRRSNLVQRDSENNNYKPAISHAHADRKCNTMDGPNSKIVRRSSSDSGNGTVWNVKSMLRKKRQGLPKLCPELEGAIVKSESLAYLTELELLARHQRNKDIERQIEQRVLQQLGIPSRTEYESNC